MGAPFGRAALGAFAILAIAVATPARAQTPDPWRFDLIPFVWGTGLDGTETIGAVEVDIDASAGDLVDFLDGGGSLRFEARSNPWGWFAEGNYFRLEHEKTVPAGTVDSVVEQTIAEAGVIHRIHDSLEAYVGVRYQSVDTRVDVPLVGTIEGDPDWTDGIIGLRWSPVRNDLGAVWLRADIGAGGSDFTWLAQIGGAWRFNKTWSVVAAYRYLDTDYEGAGFAWDMAQSGFGIGAGISW